MWFFIAIIGIIVAYVSGRKWGHRLYNYYRPRITYIVPYFRRKYRPLTPTLLPVATPIDDIDAKKKFDLESVNASLFSFLRFRDNWRNKMINLENVWNSFLHFIFVFVKKSIKSLSVSHCQFTFIID